MIPAQSSGAAPARLRLEGNATRTFVDYDAVGVSPLGDAAEVFVRGTVGENFAWAELLEAGWQSAHFRSESTRQPTSRGRPA